MSFRWAAKRWLGATLIGLSLQYAKVRSTAVALLVAAGVALFGLYVAWAAWTYGLLRRADVDANPLDLLFRPNLLWTVIGKINEKGAWSMRKGTATAHFLRATGRSRRVCRERQTSRPATPCRET